MKNRFLYMLLSSMLFFSCTGLDKVLVKKEGSWDVTRVHKKLWINDTFYSENEDNSPESIMIFNDDKSGSFTDSMNVVQPFTWSSAHLDQSLLVEFTDTTGTYTIDYSVSQLEKKSMSLAGTWTVIYQGDTFVEERELDLVRND